MQAFLRLYDNLKHGEILQFVQKTLSAIRSRRMLWSTDILVQIHNAFNAEHQEHIVLNIGVTVKEAPPRYKYLPWHPENP